MTQGVEGDRQLLHSNYIDHEDACFHSEGNLNTSVFPVPASSSSVSEGTCNQSPLCSFINPVYNDTELGHSSLADRVLWVMAKLALSHKNLLLCACSWIHCRAKQTYPVSPGNGRGDRASSPKASAWQAAQGMEEAAVQHTHGTSRHAHQTCCRAGVTIPNKYKAGIR